MELLKLRPEQLRDAVTRNVPVLLPVGSYEYHHEHLPLGTDTLIAEGICLRIAEKTEAVVAMPVYFMPTMNWAAGIEDGDCDFSPDALFLFVKEYLAMLLGMGFRKIYAIIGHQGREGHPASLFRLAANSLIREDSLQNVAGWGGLRQGEPSHRLFGCIKTCDYDEFINYDDINETERMPVGHAGRGETQLIMALYDDLVCMEKLRTTDKYRPTWLRNVFDASKENGEHWIELCAESWAKHMKGE